MLGRRRADVRHPDYIAHERWGTDCMHYIETIMLTACVRSNVGRAPIRNYRS